MYSCSTLFSKYFRRYGPWKYKKCQARIWRPPWWFNETDLDFCHRLHTIFQPHANFICTWTLKCLISVRKSHALPFILCYEFNSVHVNLLILKGNGKIYFVIMIISSVFVIILQNLKVMFLLLSLILQHIWNVQNAFKDLQNFSKSMRSATYGSMFKMF
jgi:hypothetical protein